MISFSFSFALSVALVHKKNQLFQSVLCLTTLVLIMQKYFILVLTSGMYIEVFFIFLALWRQCLCVIPVHKAQDKFLSYFLMQIRLLELREEKFSLKSVPIPLIQMYWLCFSNGKLLFIEDVLFTFFQAESYLGQGSCALLRRTFWPPTAACCAFHIMSQRSRDSQEKEGAKGRVVCVQEEMKSQMSLCFVGKCSFCKLKMRFTF